MSIFFRVYFFFDFLCFCCSPGTMPRRADVLRRPETANNNPADKKPNNDFHNREAAAMPQAKENGHAHAAKTSTLDTIKQALNTDNNDKEPSDYNEREAAVMPQAKESSHAHAVKTSTLDTNKQTLSIDKNADTRIASGREINKLTDNQDP